MQRPIACALSSRGQSKPYVRLRRQIVVVYTKPENYVATAPALRPSRNARHDAHPYGWKCPSWPALHGRRGDLSANFAKWATSARARSRVDCDHVAIRSPRPTGRSGSSAGRPLRAGCHHDERRSVLPEFAANLNWESRRRSTNRCSVHAPPDADPFRSIHSAHPRRRHARSPPSNR